jgi:hypothetical protein
MFCVHFQVSFRKTPAFRARISLRSRGRAPALAGAMAPGFSSPTFLDTSSCMRAALRGPNRDSVSRRASQPSLASSTFSRRGDASFETHALDWRRQ